MKQFATILCSLAFVIAGAMIIGIKQQPSSISVFPGTMSTYAQPKLFNPDQLKLPLTPQLTLDERTTVVPPKAPKDTVYLRDTVTIIKRRKVTVPEVVEVHDTLCVPVFFVATPLEYEVESTEIIPIDEVQGCGCPETNPAFEEQGEQ